MGNTKEPLGTERLRGRVPCRASITICQLLTGHNVERNEPVQWQVPGKAGAGTKPPWDCTWEEPGASGPGHAYSPTGSATHPQGKLKPQALTALHSRPVPFMCVRTWASKSFRVTERLMRSLSKVRETEAGGDGSLTCLGPRRGSEAEVGLERRGPGWSSCLPLPECYFVSSVTQPCPGD